MARRPQAQPPTRGDGEGSEPGAQLDLDSASEPSGWQRPRGSRPHIISHPARTLGMRRLILAHISCGITLAPVLPPSICVGAQVGS